MAKTTEMHNLTHIIDAEEAKLKPELKAYQRLLIYNSIIEYRKNSQDDKVRKHLYGNIKSYFSNAVSAIEEPFFEYYEIEETKIISILKGVTLSEQVSLLGYLQNLLKKNGYGEKYRWLSKLEKRRVIAFHCEHLTFRNSLKILRELITYNAVTITCTILLLFVSYSALLLPAPNESWVCFKPELKQYSSIPLFNHFLNTMLSFLCLDDDFKINPVNAWGVLLVIVFKGLVFISVVGYLYEQLKQRIKF